MKYVLQYGSASSRKRSKIGRNASISSSDTSENYTVPLKTEWEDWPACTIENNSPYRVTDKKIMNFIAKVKEGKKYKNVNYAIPNESDQYFVVDTEQVQVDQSPRNAHEIVQMARALLLDFLFDNNALIDLKFEDIKLSEVNGQILFSMRPLFRYSQNKTPRASFAHPILLIAHKGCVNQFPQDANAAWDIAMTAVSYHLSMLFFILRGFQLPGDHVDYYAWSRTPGTAGIDCGEFSRHMLNTLGQEVVKHMPWSMSLFEIVRPYAMTILYAHLGQEMLLKNNKRDYDNNHEFAKPYRRQAVDHDQVIAPLFFWTGLAPREWERFFGNSDLYSADVPSQANEKLHSCTDLFNAQCAVKMTIITSSMEEKEKQYEVKCIACTYIDGKPAVVCTYKNSNGQSKLTITDVQEDTQIAEIRRMRPNRETFKTRCAIVSFTCEVGSRDSNLRPKCPCQKRLGCTFIHIYHACMALNGFIEV